MKHHAARSADADARSRGQALVEFSLSIMVFLVFVVGIFDVGRAIYVYNGLAEAAREIARRTIVYPGATDIGTSPQTLAVVATQQGMIPGMTAPSFLCVDVTGAANGHEPCKTGDYVRVTTLANYTPSVLLGMGGAIQLKSAASMQIP